MTDRARDLVLRAVDSGWEGPPFDPLRLLNLLKIDAMPRDDVRDARTIPEKGDRVRVEFNPSLPSGRVRFSLAHEIAHTLFPDCGEKLRQRARHSELQGDEWQLEALCNIGAAEIVMPFAAVSAKLGGDHDIERLLEVRKEFDVSTEALFIRAARLAETERAMFCASRVETGAHAGRYRVDYMIPSHSWQGPTTRVAALPKDTVLAECTAIGFTATGIEKWATKAEPSKVEAVGVPPYPGSRYPRVVGMLSPATTTADHPVVPHLRYVRGSALEPRGTEARVVLHVVNDKTANWGGGGFAQALRGAWPEVQDDFKDWAQHRQLRLGDARIIHLPGGVSVASVVAQHGYGASAKPRIRYLALRDGLKTVAAAAASTGATIHMPRIGAGNAGGSWAIIEEIVRATLCDAGLRVTVYDLPNTLAPAIANDQPTLGI